MEEELINPLIEPASESIQPQLEQYSRPVRIKRIARAGYFGSKKIFLNTSIVTLLINMLNMLTKIKFRCLPRDQS